MSGAGVRSSAPGAVVFVHGQQWECRSVVAALRADFKYISSKMLAYGQLWQSGHYLAGNVCDNLSLRKLLLLTVVPVVRRVRYCVRCSSSTNSCTCGAPCALLRQVQQ